MSVLLGVQPKPHLSLLSTFFSENAQYAQSVPSVGKVTAVLTPAYFYSTATDIDSILKHYIMWFSCQSPKLSSALLLLKLGGPARSIY